MKNIQSKYLSMLAICTVAATILFNIAACGNEKDEANESETMQITPASQSSLTATTIPPRLTSDGKKHPENFRTGHFVYGNSAQFGGFEINRTKESQLDSGGLDHLAILFDLAWDNDTAYTLKFRKMVANPNNIKIPDPKGMYRKCFMTEFTDSSYLEISTSTMSKDTIRTVILKR
ncbi:MAG: hypothetical protein IPM82_17465 [Saprospiraceae bacterium]|nr:hypothetical protein [Saprospiraceae bacterium]